MSLMDEQQRAENNLHSSSNDELHQQDSQRSTTASAGMNLNW